MISPNTSTRLTERTRATHGGTTLLSKIGNVSTATALATNKVLQGCKTEQTLGVEKIVGGVHNLVPQQRTTTTHDVAESMASLDKHGRALVVCPTRTILHTNGLNNLKAPDQTADSSHMPWRHVARTMQLQMIECGEPNR